MAEFDKSFDRSFNIDQDVVYYDPITTGIARNLKDDNIVKTAEFNKLKKPTIFFTIEKYPKLSDFKIFHNAEWKDIDSSLDVAILPKIVQDNQNIFSSRKSNFTDELIKRNEKNDRLRASESKTPKKQYIIVEDTQPVLSNFKIFHKTGWQDSGNSGNNAILSKITQNNQGIAESKKVEFIDKPKSVKNDNLRTRERRKPIIIVDDLSPTKLSEFKIYHNSDWKSSNNSNDAAILAKVTQKNQNSYLPNKQTSKRGISK